MAKIEQTLFYQYLDELFKLKFEDVEKKRLERVFSYWYKSRDGGDERLLAYVLAKVHHRSLLPPNLAEATLTNKQLRALLRRDFKVQRSEWITVSQITEDTEETDNAFVKLSNMF